jgi:hypothetical protein
LKRRRRFEHGRAVEGEITRFRVKPFLRDTRYILVRVFRNRALMYRYAQRNGTPGRDYAGICRIFTARRYRERSAYTLPLVAEILVPHTEMSLEVISHEATHAAIAFVRRYKEFRLKRKRLDLSDLDLAGSKATEDEEAICYLVGRIVTLINDRWTPTWEKMKRGHRQAHQRRRRSGRG